MLVSGSVQEAWLAVFVSGVVRGAWQKRHCEGGVWAWPFSKGRSQWAGQLEGAW